MIQNGHANKGSCETQDTNNTAGDDIDIGLLEDAEIIDDEEQPDVREDGEEGGDGVHRQVLRLPKVLP